MLYFEAQWTICHFWPQAPKRRREQNARWHERTDGLYSPLVLMRQLNPLTCSALGASWAPLSPSIQVSYARTTAINSANGLIPSPSEGEFNQTLFTLHSTMVDNYRSKCNFISVLLLMVKCHPSNFVSTVVKTECVTILLHRNICIQHDASLQRLCHWNTSMYQIIHHTRCFTHDLCALLLQSSMLSILCFSVVLKSGLLEIFFSLGFYLSFLQK